VEARQGRYRHTSYHFSNLSFLQSANALLRGNSARILLGTVLLCHDDKVDLHMHETNETRKLLNR
jgi:hypothetical protein